MELNKMVTKTMASNIEQNWYNIKLKDEFPQSFGNNISLNFLFIRNKDTETQRAIGTSIINFFSKEQFLKKYLIELGEDLKNYEIRIYPMSLFKSNKDNEPDKLRIEVECLGKARGDNITYYGAIINRILEYKNIKIASISFTDKKINLTFEMEILVY